MLQPNKVIQNYRVLYLALSRSSSFLYSPANKRKQKKKKKTQEEADKMFL